MGSKNAGATSKKDVTPAFGIKFGGNLLSRKLYMHYHRQCGV